MSHELNQLRMEHLDKSLDPYKALRKRERPSQGWLKSIREALGRTQRQQAQRLGITGPSLHKSEKAEAEDRITLGQLRKLADGLDCDLVYALVPRQPISEVVQQRARELAVKEIGAVTHTMALEGQRPGDDRVRRQIDSRAAELLRERWSALWR